MASSALPRSHSGIVRAADRLNDTTEDPEGGDTLHAIDEHETLSLPLFVGVVFLATAGGPFGMEDAIGSGGPFLALLFSIILPFLWSLPCALMTTELSIAIPHDGGFVLWVDRAYGNFWAFQNGWWTLLYSLSSIAIYPNMITDYCARTWHISVWKTDIMEAAVVIVSMVLNILGTEAVGTFSLLLSVFILLPFVLMVVLGFPLIKDPSVLLRGPQHFNLYTFTSVMLWSNSGWDYASLVAGEVENPDKVYFPAMMLSVGLAAGLYFLVLVVGVGVVHADLSRWTDGYFSTVSGDIARLSLGGSGQWLRVMMVTAGVTGSFGTMNAQLCTSARAIFGMGHLGLAPTVFTRLHKRFLTPWVAITFQGLIVILLAHVFSFRDMVKFSMVFYSLSLIIKFSAFLTLRTSEPDMRRPFVVPGSLNFLKFAFVPAYLLCVAAIVMTSPKILLPSAGLAVLGPILFYLMVFLKKHTSLFLKVDSTAFAKKYDAETAKRGSYDSDLDDDEDSAQRRSLLNGDRESATL